MNSSQRWFRAGCQNSLVLSDGEDPVLVGVEVEPRDAALVGVVVAHVVHPVVVVRDGELGDDAGLEADEDLPRRVVVRQRRARATHVVAHRRPVLKDEKC